MKNIFKSSGILLLSMVFFASCSKNSLTVSSAQQERMARLSAELEQTNTSAHISNATPVEQAREEGKKNNSLRESEHRSKTGVKKMNPVKTFKAIKQVRKFIKEHPEVVKKADSAEKSGLSDRMRLGLLLAAIGLIIMLILGILGPFYWIGAIFLVIGLVLIIMELLEM
ncbi:MAG: hypothetical protein ACJ75J_07610 [Cytophagaceae bacterium]